MPVRPFEPVCPCSSGAFPDAFLTRLPLGVQRSSQPCPPSARPVERSCHDPRNATTRSRRQQRRHPLRRGAAVRDRARMGDRRSGLRRRVPPLLPPASLREQLRLPDAVAANPGPPPAPLGRRGGPCDASACLLYTSDAADDLTRVDLGGRRIIK